MRYFHPFFNDKQRTVFLIISALGLVATGIFMCVLSGELAAAELLLIGIIATCIGGLGIIGAIVVACISKNKRDKK